ncbi:multiple inositol polyphosphate phosphatase 1-like isoform X1 [Pistacia vera]|uniref:multiple inositol polyphosphate phosphatase 1-like isoform X1 n=1 Tax=Pistacia vera TaxID=55513 RepID=UPI0012636B5D|nr:multiple inositol polyphosphate phosphatase 1-like isoform X1 [Pistacia vera]
MKIAMASSMLILFLILLSQLNDVVQGFDVRQHLSTVTRYNVVKDVADKNFVPSEIPDGCTPIHLNLVARHGTRAPTKKRMGELDRLADHLEVLVREVEENHLSLEKVPAWLRGWKSPWRGKLKGGELIGKGEDELYDLGIRIRERFPDLFNEDYHPDIYTMRATQVPRASASAVAFGMGLFSERGSLGPGRHRAFAVTSESRASDIKLRFHDCCDNYKNFRTNREPAVNKLKEPTFDEITSSLRKRYGLNFTRQDISSLWFLCKQEASLLDITDQACGLFSPSELALLEWTDDLEVFILKGYGESLNYRMGVPLLGDVVQSMEEAIKAKEEKHTPGSYEKASLRFAHAETVVPFTCLLGLFLERSQLHQIQREEPLQLPPKPPQSRNWRGSIVAPFAGNNMLVLYSCPANVPNKYFVQVLHNEHPIPVPGCDGTDFCPFNVFKERIVAPHLKHDFDTLCNVKTKPVQKSEPSKLSPLFRWIFSLWNGNTQSQRVEL